MKNKIYLSIDSRDKLGHQEFGQLTTDEFEDNKNFDDSTILEKIQPVGDVKCVLYTTTYIAQNKTKKEYDIEELWNRVPHTAFGTDPRDVLKEITQGKGFLIKGTSEYDASFNSYFRADTGVHDAFDNVRSMMSKVNSPIMICSYWFENWLNLAPNSAMPIGVNALSGHAYANKGWLTLNSSGTAFIIEWWGGYTLEMPRETFNQAMKSWGAQTWVLSTKQIEETTRISFLQKIRDSLLNSIILLINFFRQGLITQNTLTQTVSIISKIDDPIKTDYQVVKEAIQPPKEEFPRYQWDTIEHIRKSIRIICDEVGLTLLQKDMACDICSCESGFNVTVRGRVDSHDRGLFQWNSVAHPEITDEIAFNPEKNARLAAQAIKQGKAHQYWSASEHCWNKTKKYNSIL